MNAFVGKSHYVSLVLFLLSVAFAKAQTSTSTQEIKEFSISSEDDRDSLFKIINVLKDNYSIQTKFKKYELGRQGLTTLELEFTGVDGNSKTISTTNSNGIEPQIIKVDIISKQILYAGIRSENSDVQNISVAGKPDLNIKTQTGQPGTANRSRTVTDTYSIKSTTVTDPDELEKSQVDMTGPTEIVDNNNKAAAAAAAAADKKSALEAEKQVELQRQQANKKALELKATKEKEQAAEMAAEKQKANAAVAAKARLEAEKQEVLSKELAADNAKKLKEDKARQSAAADKKAKQQSDKLAARQKELVEKKATQLKKEESIEVANVEEEELVIENDLKVKRNIDRGLEKKKKTDSAAAAQGDAASMKQTIADLKRLQEKDRRKVKKSEMKNQGYVFINAKQYNYEVYKSRTLIFDDTERTVLVIPAELDERAVSGVTSINGLRYQFHYRDNIITLSNGSGELVGLDGKEL